MITIIPREKIIIRIKDLELMVGLKRSAIYTRINPKSDHFDPEFPRPVPLGGKAVGWILVEVEAYISMLCAKRDQAISQ